MTVNIITQVSYGMPNDTPMSDAIARNTAVVYATINTAIMPADIP